MWEAARRPTRMGSLAELGIADGHRIRDLLASGDATTARTYIEYMHPHYLFIFLGGVEWALRFAELTAERSSEKETRAVCDRVHRRLCESFASSGAVAAQANLPDVLDAFDARCVAPPALQSFVPALGALLGGHPVDDGSLVARLCSGPNAAFGELLGGIESKQAVELFGRYVEQVRIRHDCAVAYVWLYASALNDDRGQGFAEDAIEQSFHACSFFEPMLGAVTSLGAEDLALMAAEHLRHHFSGPGREGGVEVIEESDRFRLVVEPCGTGGALRRRQQTEDLEGLSILAEASPATWGRAGQVPAYCAHCAHNEIISARRLGYPAWVTEFDPDPSKPCGWTVYKDPASIPDEYFTRIGIERRPSPPTRSTPE